MGHQNGILLLIVIDRFSLLKLHIMVGPTVLLLLIHKHYFIILTCSILHCDIKRNFLLIVLLGPSIHPTPTRVLRTTILNFLCIYYFCYYYIGGPLKLIQIADCNNTNCHPTTTMMDPTSDDGS